MRIIYMGSPQEAIAPLKWLLDSAPSSWQVVGVVSQAAKPQGRRKKLEDPPVAAFAKERGLKVFQPLKASSEASIAELVACAPEVIVTCAYGQILSRKFLTIPQRATINIHPSDLPRYRGAIPVNAALLDGCTSTAVTILFTVKELDAGHIILQKQFTIEPEETADKLLRRLFEAAGPLLEEALTKLQDTTFVGTPQDPTLVTHCQKIEKTDGHLQWQQSAVQIFNRYRAFQPWPGVYSFLDNKRLVWDKVNYSAESLNQAPGTLSFCKKEKVLKIACSDGSLKITRLTPEGGKPQTSESFWNGLKNREGLILS